VLWLAPRLSASSAFLVAAAAFALGSLNEWAYLAIVVPLWISILNSVGPPCIFGLTVSFRNRILKGQALQAALIVPALWVAYEYLSEAISVHGTIGNLGYSQMNFLPILQIASVTGIWGISFSIFLFAAVSAAFFGTASVKQKRTLAIALATYLFCVLGYGYWRLASTPKNSPVIKVGLMASDDSMNLIVPTTEDAGYAFDRFGKQMLSMASQGIQLFMLPEHSGPVTDASEPATDAKFEELARQTPLSLPWELIALCRRSPGIRSGSMRQMGHCLLHMTSTIYCRIGKTSSLLPPTVHHLQCRTAQCAKAPTLGSLHSVLLYPLLPGSGD
jgi:apolipoprotein N-acyltransferase